MSKKAKPQSKAPRKKPAGKKPAKSKERAGHGEIKKWFLRVLNNAGGEITWSDLLAKFGKKYPGKQTAVLYSYFTLGLPSSSRTAT